MALPAQAAPAPSENATVNLIRLLVQQGVIKQDQADALVAQAEAEAKSARATGNDRGAAVAQAGDVRVPYIPQTVRDQIRDEVKAEVMTQAKEENWAQPNTFPDWVSRITVEGDVRVRDESRLYSGSNSNEITDFARLNAKGPYDVNPQGGNSYPPMLNTREDRRNQLRVRARLGVRAELSESWTAGIRLATGSDDSPVSTSQTLGGGMSKKDIWLDQAYLTYRPTKWATVTGGRIGNPFDSTDMLFSNDLNFDGVAAIFKHPLQGRDVTLFGTLGAFSTEYSANGWNSSSFKEGKSEDKWLLAAQAGAEWKVNNRNTLRGSLAYYHFDNIAGKRSSPCSPWNGDQNCDTDWSRPAFMQKGNTLFLLRDIMANPANPGATPQPQFVGLASVRPAGREPALGYARVRRPGPAPERQLHPQPGLQQGQDLEPLAGSSGQQLQRERRSAERSERLDAAGHAGPFVRPEGEGRLAGLRRLQVHPAGCLARRLQRFVVPPGRHQRARLLHRRQLRLRQERLWRVALDEHQEVYGAPLAIDTMQFEINARF